MAEFLMPKLGADMDSGLLAAWKKSRGDVIQRGEIIAEVETEKGTIDVECFTSGVLEKLLVEPGQRVPVGTPLAIVRETEAAASLLTATLQEPVAENEFASATPATVKTDANASSSSTSRTDVDRQRISPAARRLARELGVDPISLRGSGQGGAITREDIEQAAAERKTVKATLPNEATATAPTDRVAKIRQAIAAAMTRSKREIPHYYLSTTIHMQTALDWLARQNAQRSVTDRLLYGVLLVKATALALREVPELNAWWEQDRVTRQERIHVGVAISLRQGGLIAPAIHDTDQTSLDELMKRFRDLVNRARSGGLRSSEISDPTITVTSLGEAGVETVFGVIYPPQTAIVGFGKIVERPWVVNGQVVVRSVLTASLSADHRVTDGHCGGRLLAVIDRLLQEPEKL